MAGMMHPCQDTELVEYKTPWGLTVTVNRAVKSRLRLASRRAARLAKWDPKRIDSYNCRKIRDSNTYSRHAYGGAWDFFDKPYPQPVDVWGKENAPSERFARVYELLGFTWGGRWQSRPDYPHIEWRSDYVPPLTQRERYRTWRETGKLFRLA